MPRNFSLRTIVALSSGDGFWYCLEYSAKKKKQKLESRCLTFPPKENNFVASKLTWNARQKLPITGIKKFN